MNLKDLRTAIFSQTDWAPTQSTEAITRLNGFINRAYNDVCLELLSFSLSPKLSLRPKRTRCRPRRLIPSRCLFLTSQVP